MIILILLLSQRAGGRREGKQPAVPQESPLVDPFFIDLAETDDPIGSIKKLLKKIGKELLRLVSIHPQTQEIKDRAAELLRTSQNFKVSINEIFNYYKSSIMVFMLCSFMTLIKIWMHCLYRVICVILNPIPMMRPVLQVVQVDHMFHSPLVFSTEYI